MLSKGIKSKKGTRKHVGKHFQLINATNFPLDAGIHQAWLCAAMPDECKGMDGRMPRIARVLWQM